MANTAAPVDTSTGKALHIPNVAVVDGKYGFRFRGRTMSVGNEYRLAGVGFFELSNGKLSGHHRSSITDLHGQSATLTNTHFSLPGTVIPSPEDDPNGYAKTPFSTQEKEAVPLVQGTSFSSWPDRRTQATVFGSSTLMTPYPRPSWRRRRYLTQTGRLGRPNRVRPSMRMSIWRLLE